MNRCARLTLLLLPLLLLFALPAGVSAHAHLVRADLAPDGHLRISAGTVHFWFDEPINPSLSRIIIRDASGRQVNTDTGTLDPANSEQLDMGIPTLADGQYTVTWTSDSAQDGHILHGFYLFTVGGADAAAPSAEPASVSVPQDPTLDTPALAVAFSHWLVLVACAIWTGALAFDFLVLARARKRPGTALAHRRSVAREPLQWLAGGCLVRWLPRFWNWRRKPMRRMGGVAWSRQPPWAIC